MNKHQKLAIRALSNMMSDDAARARAAFKGLSEEEMQKEYGKSGKTRARILADYEARESEIEQAIIWVKSIAVKS